MLSASYKTRLATVMAGAALACTLIVSGASAMPARDAMGPASAPNDRARTYSDLRTPDAREAGELASTPKAPERTYSDLRTPDARDASDGYRPTAEAQPAADIPSSPSAFDWVSAAIGAAAGTGLLLIALAAMAGSARLRHPHSVRHGSAGS